MDINIYIAILVFPIIFALIGILARKGIIFAFFPFLGAIIAAYAFLGVGQDGSLSSNFTGTANILATSGAGGNAFAWMAVILIPGFLAFMCAVIALGKALKLI